MHAGTADMDPIEAIALVFGFYAAALLSYAYLVRNPLLV